jgi:HEPN domain-containing protein
MDSIVLAAGVVTTGLSLGAGIWQSVRGGHHRRHSSAKSGARREIPDPQIKDAADQYEQARRVLSSQGEGVLLPLLNNASMAVELYLKSLCARKIHRPELGSDLSKVHPGPPPKHVLKDLFDAIPSDYRERLENDFRERSSLELRETLQRFESLFQESRYAFEEKYDIQRYPLGPLMIVSEFLCEFIAHLTPIERIEGATPSPDYSPSDIRKFEAKKAALLERLDKG